MFRRPLAGSLLALIASTATAAPVDFVREVRPIFERHCYSCHAAEKQKSGLRVDVKAAAFTGGDLYGASIVAGKPDESPLVQFVADENADLQMPPEGDRLSADEIAVLRRWVAEGAVWPDGVDLAQLEDRTDHWSFHPIERPQPPAVDRKAWVRGEIDRFILARLEQEGLEPAPPAGRATWLRRVSLDLTGLPPTPEQVRGFLADHQPDAFERQVDRLLASPRYGERWAQHWLDVVRYADTHGFEVNTERPNAWPYRDYVIRALNDDVPYDQFIRGQILGDALGEGAATGFLVTASVLLPGQIGKDAASMRLARQDSLDEIVVNVGQTFLGLSVGCARCHDHKFDPISQRDYYSMQAFIAGVHYGDRQLDSTQNAALHAEQTAARERVAELERRLAGFVPLARVDLSATAEPNAQRNEHSFEPRPARFVRFTVHAANRHPSLGVIEPCIDEFEIFAAGGEPHNVALASLGTKVTASGSRESGSHQLEFIHDGRYGNSRSWMSDEAGRGWVLFELPETLAIDRIVWSRDREGGYQDRLATAFTIEAGPSLDAMDPIVSRPPPRPSVTARQNVDRFAPVRAERLRMTIRATNSLQPCIDELEIFDTAGENVALASRGVVTRSSGNITEANRHDLAYLNDGNYGNSRSWLSNRSDESWVELELPAASEIERVVWSRDREGKFTDRLATEYTIEVADEAGSWRTVATSADRRPLDAEQSEPAAFSTAGLSAGEAAAAGEMLREKQRLERRLAEITQALTVFAGIFRAPDDIHLLRRGDPEQPVEPVTPAVLEALGELELPRDAGEQRRRAALADWIVDVENPLTARVMANRIWQGHFGVGLVETSNDFGRNGAQPTHPALLDWLATELVRGGWSIKSLHRQIVLSATYRQAAAETPSAAAVDAQARLLWRYPARRLEGEAIRDSILTVSGRLNLKMGGSGFNLFDKRGGLSGFKPVESFTGDGLRRMIYAHKVRRERDAVFGAFDCPDAGQSTPRRRESTTPIQALNLLNSPFVLDQSAALAERIEREAGKDLANQIRRAYELVFSREPSDAELADIEPVARQHGLALVCRVLLNSNEFLMIP